MRLGLNSLSIVFLLSLIRELWEVTLLEEGLKFGG